jgi:hypothetical protein
MNSSTPPEFHTELAHFLKLGGLTQAKFTLLCNEYLDTLGPQGKHIRPFNRGHMSRVLRGEFGVLRDQVLVYVNVLHQWYHGTEFLSMFAEMGLPAPTFTREDAIALIHMAGFSTPQERNEAIQTAQMRAVSLKNIQPKQKEPATLDI